MSEDKYALTKPVAATLENGILFARIARHLSKAQATALKQPEIPLSDLDLLKELSAPAARVYNWKILSDCFALLDIPLQPDLKSLIIAADQNALFTFLKQVAAAAAAIPLSEKQKKSNKDCNSLERM